MDDMRELLSAMYADSEWFRFPKRFLAVMSYQEAILLSYLINAYRVCMAEERNGGWFYCKMERIMQDLYMGRTQQTQMVKNLKDKGYITTKMSGLPAKRYFYINFEVLYHSIREATKHQIKHR